MIILSKNSGASGVLLVLFTPLGLGNRNRGVFHGHHRLDGLLVEKNVDAPVPELVQDIGGIKFQLPKAASRQEASMCVESWRTNVSYEFRGKTKNRQNPFSSHMEDIKMRDFLTERSIATHNSRKGKSRTTSEGKIASSSDVDSEKGHLWSSPERPFTFMEIGAFDGVSESNTLLFERCLNW
eukprot:CAMPEP_0172606598 /NCGR_PEP_ID=MMETSP1068-20121228/26803_1 /TAXON_ID=35684 /ORGANISM="Pseudopedinella elastica, Strain CCMP716" /LENGTH=181 /DNA_ID=CAMNT_0013409365 /DNA_START=142 /DNA_END=684 /DNA_ORIENTATION=+